MKRTAVTIISLACLLLASAALAGYRSFIQSHPLDPRVPDALWRMAQMQLDVYHELGEAEARHEGSDLGGEMRPAARPVKRLICDGMVTV